MRKLKIQGKSVTFSLFSHCYSLVWLVLVKCSFCTSTLSPSSFSQETGSIFNHRWVCLPFRTGIEYRNQIHSTADFFGIIKANTMSTNSICIVVKMYRIQVWFVTFSAVKICICFHCINNDALKASGRGFNENKSRMVEPSDSLVKFPNLAWRAIRKRAHLTLLKM